MTRLRTHNRRALSKRFWDSFDHVGVMREQPGIGIGFKADGSLSVGTSYAYRSVTFTDPIRMDREATFGVMLKTVRGEPRLYGYVKGTRR